MAIHKKQATGKAKCRICKKLIEVGSIDVVFCTYNSEFHYHQDCINKIKVY